MLRFLEAVKPRARNKFDPLRHTCRGDVLLRPPGIVVILKWSKTIQRGEQVPLIPLPATKDPRLCPVRAYTHMLRVCPTKSANEPLLMVTNTHNRRAITSSELSTTFHVIMEAMGYPKRAYILHSLRASGATAAYNAGVDFLHTKHQGFSEKRWWTFIYFALRNLEYFCKLWCYFVLELTVLWIFVISVYRDTS